MLKILSNMCLFRKLMTGFALLVLVGLSFTTYAEQDQTAGGPTLMVLGDSISAAYGLETNDGWVNLLQETLKPDYPAVHIVNASISGDTTDGGLQRLPNALAKFKPDLLIIELGGNDGLRGQSVKRMRQNLEKMVLLAQDNGADVLLLGMRIPANYGAAYTEQFFNAFGDAAEATGAALVPFFLAPIAEDRKMFQRDGVHPTKAAQPLLLEAVLPDVLNILGELCTTQETACKL